MNDRSETIKGAVAAADQPECNTRPRLRRDRDFKVRVSDGEKRHIETAADTVRLSVAAFVREVGQGRQPRDVTERQRIQDLLRVNGDLGRLAGLLKLWLGTGPKCAAFDRTQISGTFDQLIHTRDLISHTVRKALQKRPAAQVQRPVAPLTETACGPRHARLRIPVTADEKQAVLARAAQAKQSAAVYLRTCALAYRPPQFISDEVLQQVQAHGAELVQLGRLFKAYLTDEPQRIAQHPGTHEVQQALDLAPDLITALHGWAQRLPTEG